MNEHRSHKCVVDIFIPDLRIPVTTLDQFEYDTMLSNIYTFLSSYSPMIETHCKVRQFEFAEPLHGEVLVRN